MNSLLWLFALFFAAPIFSEVKATQNPNFGPLPLLAAGAQARIGDLRPTQFSVGTLEVQEKMKTIQEAKASGNLEAYYRDQVVPVIKSPDGELFMIDRHHFVRAVYELREELGTDLVYITVAYDFSHLRKRKFWKKIAKYMDLFDQLDRPISVAQIPKHVKDLVDDIYRSLAGRLRRLGHYAKTGEPFQQFKWARALRKYFMKIEFNLSENNFSEAIFIASKWAHSKDARDLPGSLYRREFCVSTLTSKPQ